MLPVYKSGTFWFTFSCQWGLNACKRLKADSSVPDTRMHSPHLLDSLCGPRSVLNMQMHPTPVPRVPRRPFSPVFVPCLDFSDSLELFSPLHACKNLISMRRSGQATPHCSGSPAQSGGLGSWAVCFSTADKVNPEQAKLGLFQKLCHKLT